MEKMFSLSLRKHWKEKKGTDQCYCQNRNDQFPLGDMPAGNHGSSICHLGLDICFDKYNYHDPLKTCLIESYVP